MTNIFSLLENIKDPLYNPDLKINSKVLLIDGMNTFFRNFSVINYLNQNGDHIGGLVGFLRSVGYVSNLIGATRVIVVFDGVGNITNKKNLLPSYKSNRNLTRVTNWDIFENKDEEVSSMGAQLDRLSDYLNCLPLSTVVLEKTEADDILAYYSKKITRDYSDSSVYIMSADKDFLQLVDERIFIYSPTKKIFYRSEDVLKEYNITPVNFLTYKILLGDKTDNVPGIEKLGPKKILKLFPELSSFTPFSLNDVLEKASLKKTENYLYHKVLINKEQLKINEKIMGLHDIILTDDELIYLTRSFENPLRVVDKEHFKHLYDLDTLGKSISNLDNWLSENFNLPNRFINEHTD